MSSKCNHKEIKFMFKKYVLQHKKWQQQVFVTIRVYRKTVFDIFFYICDMEILFWIFTILLIVALSALLIVQYGEKFRFDASKCAEYVGCSRHYVYRGRKELEDADIIKRANSRSYFVNPNILYKGNRDRYGKVR